MVLFLSMEITSSKNASICIHRILCLCHTLITNKNERNFIPLEKGKMSHFEYSIDGNSIQLSTHYTWTTTVSNDETDESGYISFHGVVTSDSNPWAMKKNSLVVLLNFSIFYTCITEVIRAFFSALPSLRLCCLQWNMTNVQTRIIHIKWITC